MQENFIISSKVVNTIYCKESQSSIEAFECKKYAKEREEHAQISFTHNMLNDLMRLLVLPKQKANLQVDGKTRNLLEAGLKITYRQDELSSFLIIVNKLLSTVLVWFVIVYT